jgi:hypothetical protein
VQSVESQPTFCRNISLPSSGPKNKPSKKPACLLLHVDFLLGVFFDPEVADDIFLRNVG